MDPIEEIKNKLNIVDIIGEYVKLQKAGKNWRGLCPFHHEKTPSFYVSEDKQLWHCFGCGKGGGIFDFIMEIENITFPEALKILAQRAGVKLDNKSFKNQSQKEKIYQINRKAALFFQKNLFSQQGKRALEYLKKRGLSEKTIREFKLGFAFDSWHSLENYLKETGFNKKDLISAGLISEKNDKTFDRFRSRIMFPFFSLAGEIAGFTGRIFDKQEQGAGKYVNTPETQVFNKSSLIYGLFQAKNFIKNSNKVLIVEGQMDFLTAWEREIKFALATSGTAFTESQLKIISRYTKNLFLCFDMDEAGQMASERIIPQALAMDFKINILSLPQGKDLADFLLKAKKEDIKNLLKEAKPVMDFYFKRALNIADKNTLEGKKEIANFFLKKVKNISSPIEQGFWVEKLAQSLKVKEEYLYQVLENIKPEKVFLQNQQEIKNQKTPKQFFLPKNRWQTLAQKLLSLILIDPKKFLPMIKEIVDKKYFFPRDIFLAIKSLEGEKTDKETENFIAYLQLRNSYLFSQDQEKFDFEKELKSISKELKKEYYKNQIEQLSLELKNPETQKNKEKSQQIAQKINKYLKDLNDLN